MSSIPYLVWWSVQNYTYLSIQFSRSVVSDSLRPHESQHTRPPCPSPTPRVHSDSRPSSQWCHPAISSSVVPFSSCPKSLPASESFPMSQLFAWGGQSTGVSALASLLPKKSQVYVYPLPFESPSCLSPHPTPLGWYRAPVWVSWAIQQIPVGHLFYIWFVSFHVTLSIHLTLSSPLTMSISLFSMSVSPLLPCK